MSWSAFQVTGLASFWISIDIAATLLAFETFLGSDSVWQLRRRLNVLEKGQEEV